MQRNQSLVLSIRNVGSLLFPIAFYCCMASTSLAQGIAVTGVGPVNRSMGGAGTAAALDAIGAVHWNPGSITTLQQSELSFGLELINVDIELSSTIGGATNATSGDGGFSPIPTVGWVHHIDDSPLTIGLGVNAIAGFKNNQPADASNPLLAAGPAFASAEFLQIVPTLACRLTDRLSVGIAPTVTLANLTLDPLGPSVVTPANVPGSGNRMHWGGGFQVGVHYIANCCWQYGFTYKSRQWFEEFNFFVPGGTVQFDLDYPMILSLGTAFTGWHDWTIAADARYFDYENSDGFRDLGFSSVFAFAIGAQYRASNRLTLRTGYNANANPISDGDVFTNIVTPLIQQQNVAVGASLRIACNVQLNAAYVHLVKNDVTGPLPSPPFGANDTMSNEIVGHSALLGITVQY